MALPGMPPSLTGVPPMGAAPVGVPSGNPGAQAAAMAKIASAIKILEQQLQTLPTGSDPYKSVLSAIQSLSKHVNPADATPGVDQSALRGLMQDASRSAPMMSLMRSLGGPSAGAAGGGAMPMGGGLPPT
jgi:hypothetical protein